MNSGWGGRQGRLANLIRHFRISNRTNWYNRTVGKDFDFRDYIVTDERICGGQPVIAGTRVTLRTLLASLAEGAGVQEILDEFPSINEEAIRAVIAFAAQSAEEDLPLPSLPKFI